MQICNYPGLLSTLKSDLATPLARLLLPQSAGSNGSTLKCDPATPLALSLALALMVAYFFFPASASAHTVQASAGTRSGPALQVNAGFNARYRDGNWVPVQISLSNNGPDFSGMLSIAAPSPFGGPGNPTSTYKKTITLANGAQKQVTMYVPLNFGAPGSTQSIKINLLDDNGNVVRSQTSTLTSVGENDVFVAVLSDQNLGFNPLYSISLPNQGGSMVVEPLNASTLPDTATILKNFNLIVLDNFTTSNLSNDQLAALQTWVNQGGALIEVGGPEWRRTLSTLPTSLLPATINGTSTLPAGTHLLPIGGPTGGDLRQGAMPGTVNAPVIVSTATLAQANKGDLQSATILAASSTPLIVQAHQGQGIICYLAFDPTLAPIINWPGAGVLWKGLVLRALGDGVLNSSNNFAPGKSFQTGGLAGLLQNLLAHAPPSPWLLLVLLLGYLIILGPVRFLLVRWRKRRDWNWRIVLSSIVIFSLLSYGLAIQQKGAAILSNRVSIIQLNQGGSSAYITTYLGTFVLDQGDYQVHIPGNGLIQPSSDQQFNNGSSADSEPITTIIPGQNGTEVNLQGVNFSTVSSLLSEQDLKMPGGITAQLTLASGTLIGTVTNRLSYSLRDVYVLMNNNFVRIGDLLAGQSAQVHLRLNSSIANPAITLADQIAESYQLPTPYSAIAENNGSSHQDELQRHLAILSALSGEGEYAYTACSFGSCKGISVVSSYLPRLKGPALGTTNSSDPLLVAGSAATLIGWADPSSQSTNTTNNVTVNGTSPSGLQETLVQAPLNVIFSGTLNLPPDFITGQIINVQGNSVQIQPTGAYTLTTGNLTFEFTVPTKLQVSNLTISEPSNLSQGAITLPGSGAGSVVDANQLQASLYNWQTGSWDTITLNNFSFSTPDAGVYIGQSGRVLLQLGNQDSTVGTIYFGRPSLNLQGTIS